MTRGAARKPHERSKAGQRIGRSAPPGDPWAARVREAILGDAHPSQGDAITDPSRRISILTGRGGGKTSTYKGRYLLEMTATTKGKFIYACPTLGMAIDLLWEPLKQACEQLGIMDECDWKEAPREGGKILTIKRTGSRLKLFGADDKKQINLCRGQPFNGVGCDEVGFWPSVDLVNNFVEKVIEPRIGERDGWIALASTPGTELRGLFYDVTRDGSPSHRPYRLRDDEQYAGWKRVQWSSHGWSLADVIKLPNAEVRYRPLVALRNSHIEIRAAKGWGDTNPVWLREYEGRWAADGTTTVYQFDPEKNLWMPHGDTPIEGIAGLKLAMEALPGEFEWHHVLIADKGSPRAAKQDEHGEKKRDGDPWAVNVLSFAPADPTKQIMHTYFLERTGFYARPVAQLLLGEDKGGENGCMPHDKPGGIFGVIGWPDALEMDADDATISELANVYGLRFEKAQKRPDYKAGAIEQTNGSLVDGRVKIIKDSPMHRQVTGLQWAEQTSGALKEDPSQSNHSTDCLVYGDRRIAALFDSGVVVDAGGDGGRGGAAPARKYQTRTYRGDDPDDDTIGLPQMSSDDFEDFYREY